MTDEGTVSAGAPAREVVVAVTGASGLLYAVDLLTALKRAAVHTHLVVTAGAKRVIPTELDGGLASLTTLASELHKDSDSGAPIASGSHTFGAMVVVPCSAGTLAKVATGMTDNLTSRVAHVALKERRPLLLVVREAPYSRPMLANMLAAADAGALIVPASPGFYHRPRTIEDLVGSVTARLLDHLGVDHARVPRWGEA